jgi:hypothetical protein
LFKSLVAVFAPITYQLEEKYKGEWRTIRMEGNVKNLHNYVSTSVFDTFEIGAMLNAWQRVRKWNNIIL